MSVGKQEPYAPGKDFDDLGVHIHCLAEDSETITNSGDGDSTTRTAVCNLAVSSHDAHTERNTESCEESWKQAVSKLTDNCA